jgi:hypothetical protein
MSDPGATFWADHDTPGVSKKLMQGELGCLLVHAMASG